MFYSEEYKNTFICLGEEIILQTIFSKVKKKKKKRIFQITRKIYKIFFKGETKCKKGTQCKYSEITEIMGRN